VRHPFFPDVKIARAVGARGRYAALAGNFVELIAARERGAHAERAIFVHDRPSEEQREILWSLFEVPVLTLLLDERRRVAAWECEAEVMHSPGGRDTCDCGRPGARLAQPYTEVVSTFSAAVRESPAGA
jgi:hypothetical protein